tara:strand:+ start:5271 stop:6281 length:1011 start_codon:yes stop_codon:yes gene_type:complete
MKSPDEWNLYFLDRGISEELATQYLVFITNLSKRNLPIIFEVEHLASLIGIKYLELNKLIYDANDFYREFSIPKRSGGNRKISTPYPSLLLCQRWINSSILNAVKVHYCAHAYKSKHSIITNAKKHIKNKVLLKMDMENFFPSIPINWVVNFFSQLGYPNNVAFALGSLCCLNDQLPQGAATSPALSNILLLKFDQRIYRLSKKYSLNYTRYADDLAFSGEYIPHKFIKIVEDITSDYGLKVNQKKTRLIVGDKKKVLTGLSVKDQELKLPRSSVREIKKELYYIRKYGLISHVSKLKIKNPHYIHSIEGRVRFWLQIEPDNEFARSSLNYILQMK